MEPTQPQHHTTEVILGISKKMNKELEELPLHEHATLITLLNSLMQMRQIAMQIEQQKQQAEAQRAHQEQAALAKFGLVTQ